MYSVTKLAVLLLAAGVTTLAAASPALRICADPDNMPYSNRLQQGFENQLADMIASDLGMEVSYTWLAQRGTFFRKTLDAGVCDVVMGVPAGMNGVRVTRPYYRSGYVFVSQQSRRLKIHSLNDPRLRQYRIGVQLLGDSDRSLPPVQALTSRGIVNNLVAYNIFGTDLDETNATSDPLRAVERGDVDVAVAWGPIAGYFARHARLPLEVDAIDPDPMNPSLPLAFDIGIGVRPADMGLSQRLDAGLARRAPEIRRLLKNFGIPQSAALARRPEGQ